jgi:hypothetical protein
VLACAAGSAFAFVTAFVAVPPLFALELRRRGEGAGGVDRRLTRWLAAPPRLLAQETARSAAGAILGAVALIALAYPLLDASSAPLGAPNASGDSLARELPVAAGVSALLLGVGFAVRARSATAAILGPVSLLPAAAAAGVVVAVFQDGTGLMGALGSAQSLSNAALGAVVVVVTGMSVTRTVAAAESIRAERELDPGCTGVAERSAALTLPSALVGTVVLSAAAGVLLGADLRAAQELGLGVAVGLVADLLLARAPMLAALARWGEARVGSRASIAWPPSWRPRLPRRWARTRPSATDSAS